MVREITLMKYFEEHLGVKCRKIKKGTIKKGSLEEFALLTNLNQEQIENNIIEFYKSQGYEYLEKAATKTHNLHIGYKFKRNNEAKIVCLTLSPESCLAIVY